MNIFTALENFDSSSEDGEEQQNRKPKLYKLRREFDDSDYKQLFRFDRYNVIKLAEMLLPNVERINRGGKITNVSKMEIFLRYVSDPGFQVWYCYLFFIRVFGIRTMYVIFHYYQIGVGVDIGISQPSVSRTVWEVCQSIVENVQHYIKFPQTNAEFQDAITLWTNKFQFPYAIRAIDCTLIPIKKPHLHGDEFICRKQYASLNVQATVNADGYFTSVDCSWAGSVHDARIWRNSSIQTIMAQQTTGALLLGKKFNYCFLHIFMMFSLGDEGYPLSPYLMTCFRNTSSEAERKFNKMLKSERTYIERCFGQLKQRFPMLYSKIRIKIERVPSFIMACFILNNIAKLLKDEFPFDDLPLEDDNNNEHEHEHDTAPNDYNLARQGKQKRSAIVALLQNEAN